MMLSQMMFYEKMYRSFLEINDVHFIQKIKLHSYFI